MKNLNQSSSMPSIIFVGILLILLTTDVDCIITAKKNLYNIKDINNKNSNNKDAIKIVHYVLKNENSLEIKTVPVRNLNIEAYQNWLAKALYNGNDYNQTGLLFF